MLERCEYCDSLIIKGKCFHAFNCPKQTLTLEEWKNEEFHRNEKIVNAIVEEFRYESEVKNMTFKELGDFLIQKYWSNEKWGSKNSVILDRIINILFDKQIEIDKDITILCK